MKYIELYLDQRKKEIEEEKREYLERFKQQYRDCKDDDDFVNLLEDVACDYYIIIDAYMVRLRELEKLRKDLLIDKEIKGEENNV